MVGRKIKLGLLLAVGIMSACSTGSDGEIDTLQEARRLWNEKGPASYQVNYRATCFCGFIEPVIVEVRADTVSAVLHPDTKETYMIEFSGEMRPVIEVLPGYFKTVDQLFELAVDASDGAAVFDAEYNADYGYPTRIYIDGNASTSDDEITYTLSGLQI